MAASIYKYLFFTIAVIISTASFSVADQQEHNAAFSCDDIVFNLVGPDTVVVDGSYAYAISVAILGSSLDVVGSFDSVIVPQDILTEVDVSYELFYGNRVLQRSSDQDFYVSFDQLGEYLIRARIVYKGCTYNLSLPVSAYTGIFSYIGPYIDEFGMGIVQNMAQNNLFLRPFILSDDVGANLLSLVRQNWSIFSQSQDIYFGVKNYSLVFDVLRLIDNDPAIDLSNKRIFIIDDMQKSILKKFLARFTRNLSDASLYVVSSQEAMNMFLQFSIGKTDHDDEMLAISRLQFGGSNWTYSLGHFIDYLLFQGFPLDMLLLILSCIFAVLLIVFSKQVLGVSSFGVYYPLLFAVSLRVVGLKTSLFLLVTAFLAKIITILFTRRFTLLATAKLGFQIIVYIFLTIIGLVILSAFGLVYGDFLVFTYPMMLFVYIAILLVASKLRVTAGRIPSSKQIISIVLFLILSGLCYLVIESELLHRAILLYPSLVLLVIILIIVLGRYTGLQLVELYRFWPLMRHLRSKK